MKKFAEDHPTSAAAVETKPDIFDTSEPKRDHPLLLKKLDEIEAEMKKVGFWADEPDVRFDAKIAAGEADIMNAPTFELWLQRVFIPRARAAATDDMLPKKSQVGQIAFKQYDYMNCVPEGHGLMVLLGEFDDLVEMAGVGGGVTAD